MQYISCYISGGLGNQLFEIFTTLSYSIDNNKTPHFKYLDVSPSCTYRPTYWNTVFKNILNYTNQNNNININYTNYNEVTSFKYTIIPYINGNVYLNGHFQSYKYFHHNKEHILNMLNFNEIKKNIYEKYKSLISTNTICIHFRYGDYKIYNKNYILPIDYYKNSIEFILNNNKNINKCICFYESNNTDNDIISTIINQLNIVYSNITFIKVDSSISDWEQMILMSLYKYIIIANSTFSWWSGYLNNEYNKTVICPYIWNGNHTDDLLLSEWHKIYW